MPVIVLEARDFTSPLFWVRTLSLLSGCVTFSLVACMDSSELHHHHHHHHHGHANTSTSPQPPQHRLPTFKVSCMFTWCFFFVLTFLIHVLYVIQFHCLLPVSWKNLTVTVAALGALMCLSACVFFPWLVMDRRDISRSVAAAVFSCLTFLAYSSEAYVIRTQASEQRGYMASAPGLLKVLQLWGGCQMIPLLSEGVYGASLGGNGGGVPHWWQLWLSGVSSNVCLLMSLGTLAVILGDCTARCPLRFDRVLAAFSVFGVVLYMVSTVICFVKLMEFRKPGHDFWNYTSKLVVMETVVASITLLAYTVDLAFSIKLLYDRRHA